LKKIEEWTTALDQGYGVDVVYLDYSKALNFDSDPHQRLVAKFGIYPLGF